MLALLGFGILVLVLNFLALFMGALLALANIVSEKIFDKSLL